MAGGLTARYRFTELGWLQFERLCAELLEIGCAVPPDGWRSHRDGLRSTLARDGLVHPVTGAQIPGPVCVVTAWWRPRLNNPRVHFERVRRDAGELPYEYWDGERPMHLLVLTNIDTQGATGWGDGDFAQVVGPDGLSTLVDRLPQLRRRMPSLLGLTTVTDLIDDQVAERSTLDLGAAVALAPVFVPTPTYAHSLIVLERYGFTVLTGPPEMGKTAIARMIGLAQMTDGWEVHECIRPAELWDRFDKARHQVFIADDAFGSTEYQPESAERWARELDGILRAMDERHWLIWTSRPAPLRAGLGRIHRERGTERFPQPAEVQVDASQLDTANKTLILFRHTRAAALGGWASLVVQESGEQIVEHPHFTPERIRRFVSGRLRRIVEHELDHVDTDLASIVEEEIAEPTSAMKASFEALTDDHRALLIALLDTPPGPVSEREIAAATRRHSEIGFTRQPSELIDRLTDHFVRVVPPTSITWVHPSWRDLVIDELASHDEVRERFLHNAEIHGLALALSIGGGREGERTFPLLLSDRDWDSLTDRIVALLRGCEPVELYRLLTLMGEEPQRTDDRVKRELPALRRTVLDQVRDRWNDSREPIAVAQLEAWLAAERLVDPPLAAPRLTETWIELLPTSACDPDSSADLARWSEWVALVRVLFRYRRGMLGEFGFPDRQSDVIRGTISRGSDLAFAGADPADHDQFTAILRELLPMLARWEIFPSDPRVHDWITARAWEPDGPSSSAADRFDRRAEPSLVERLLADLDA